MSRSTVSAFWALLRFEALQLVRKPLLWVGPAILLPLNSYVFLCRATELPWESVHHSSRGLLMLATVMGMFLGGLLSAGSASIRYLLTRPISRTQASLAYIGVRSAIGVVIFGGLATIALLIQGEAVFDTSTSIETFDDLRLFEDAGFVISFHSDRIEWVYRNWSDVPSDWHDWDWYDLQRGTIHGVWSPGLIVPILAFTFYFVSICCYSHYTELVLRGPWWRGIAWIILCLLPQGILICAMFQETFDGSRILNRVYLYPWVTAAGIVSLVLFSGLVVIRGWRHVDASGSKENRWVTY